MLINEFIHSFKKIAFYGYRRKYCLLQKIKSKCLQWFRCDHAKPTTTKHNRLRVIVDIVMKIETFFFSFRFCFAFLKPINDYFSMILFWPKTKSKKKKRHTKKMCCNFCRICDLAIKFRCRENHLWAIGMNSKWNGFRS